MLVRISQLYDLILNFPFYFQDPHSPATPTTDRKKVTLGLSVMPSFEELCELVEQQKRLIGANNSAIDAKELKLRSLKQSEAASE